jgi:hypothetical protein
MWMRHATLCRIDRATITKHNVSQVLGTLASLLARNLISVPAFYLGIRPHLVSRFANFQRRYVP